MTQTERRLFLINYLLKENPRYKDVAVPQTEDDQKYLLRSLMNVREPLPVSEEFLHVQDDYLREAISKRGITELEDITPLASHENGELYLWRKRGEQRDDGVLAALPLMHRQLHPYVCRNPAARRVCRTHEKTGSRRRNRQGKNHESIQSSVQVCASHCRSDCARPAYKNARTIACFLLHFLPEPCRRKRRKINRVLLHLDRRIHVPESESR